MRLLKTHIILVVASLLLFGCDKEDAPDCFQKAGNEATVVRELDHRIRKIEITDMIELELVQSEENFIEITGPENLLPEIITEYSNGDELKISNDNTCNFVRSFKVKFTVRIYSDVEEILNLGEGSITSINTIERDYFLLENEQTSGDIDLDFNCDSVFVLMHNGVSKIHLSGSAQETHLYHNGLGTFDASNLISEYTSVNQSSINDIHVHSNHYLFVYLSSRGNAYYSGSPSNIDLDREGSGELIPD